MTRSLEVKRFVAPVARKRIGRPPLSREAAYEKLTQLPGARVGLVNVSQPQLARRLGCHRTTAGRMIRDLEADNRLRRRRRKGRRGLLVQLLKPRPPAPPETVVIGIINGA